MKERKKALILLNETAGMGRAENDAMRIARRCAEEGWEPVLYPVVPGTDLVSEKLLEYYDGEADMVLCSGGDGTLHYVVNSVMRMKEKPLLAYIPAGSANDFAKGLGIPSDRAAALETALGGIPFSCDVGRMNDQYFTYAAAFGMFSEVSYSTRQELKNVFGYAAYVISAVGDLFENVRFSRHMRVSADGEEWEGDYLFGAVCNSVSIGGVNLFGRADVSLNDGELEMLLIRVPKSLLELQSVIGALSLRETSHPGIVFRHVRSVSFHSDEPAAWTLDGEFGGEGTDTEIAIVPQAVTIMTGR